MLLFGAFMVVLLECVFFCLFVFFVFQSGPFYLTEVPKLHFIFSLL